MKIKNNKKPVFLFIAKISNCFFVLKVGIRLRENSLALMKPSLLLSPQTAFDASVTNLMQRSTA